MEFYTRMSGEGAIGLAEVHQFGRVRNFHMIGNNVKAKPYLSIALKGKVPIKHLFTPHIPGCLTGTTLLNATSFELLHKPFSGKLPNLPTNKENSSIA